MRRNFALGHASSGEGFLDSRKQIMKTMLGQADPINFTVDNIITTLRHNGCGDTLEQKN